jgi:hypothetical protein
LMTLYSELFLSRSSTSFLTSSTFSWWETVTCSQVLQVSVHWVLFLLHHLPHLLHLLLVGDCHLFTGITGQCPLGSVPPTSVLTSSTFSRWETVTCSQVLQVSVHWVLFLLLLSSIPSPLLNASISKTPRYAFFLPFCITSSFLTSSSTPYSPPVFNISSSLLIYPPYTIPYPLFFSFHS